MELKRFCSSFPDFCCALLIVPYGIETPKGQSDADRNEAFNRTLWN